MFDFVLDQSLPLTDSNIFMYCHCRHPSFLKTSAEEKNANAVRVHIKVIFRVVSYMCYSVVRVMFEPDFIMSHHGNGLFVIDPHMETAHALAEIRALLYLH